MPGHESRRRVTVEEYHRLEASGALAPAARVELLEGTVVDGPPVTAWHAGTVDRVAAVFLTRLSPKAVVRIQNPLHLAAWDSEPAPDVVLVRPRPDHYTLAHPDPADVLLLIEVVDGSGDRDRGLKLPLYARAGIAEVWLVDRGSDGVEVYREPGPDGYRRAELRGREDGLVASAFPDLLLAGADLLG